MTDAAGEDIAACAGLVARGDADRFLAVMAASPPARDVLFPIYAFNVEVARAPWVTEESMIAEMRLQWWRDAVDEIGAHGAVRKHEVVTPLAGVLDATGAAVLAELVEARSQAGDRPFEMHALRRHDERFELAGRPHDPCPQLVVSDLVDGRGRKHQFQSQTSA